MKKQHMKQLYAQAEAAATKSIIKCPACGKEIEKTTYQKKFCDQMCKDKYWNTVKPNPASHYQKYNVGEKSHAAFKERVFESRHGEGEGAWPLGIDEGNEGWDDHK